MHLLKEEKSFNKEWIANRKPLERSSFGLSYWFSSIGITQGNSYQEALETDAFAKMHNLKFLQLGYVQLSGSYAKLPKGLKWLCWHGFHLPSIPNEFYLERLVVLEMPYNCSKVVSFGNMCLKSLKVLNLSHSMSSSINLNAAMLPNLEKLILSYCEMLVEAHESIGHLESLMLLDLSYCTCLRKLPESMSRLKYLETLDISGCSNLENFAAETRYQVYHKLWLSKRPSTWALLPMCIVSLKLRCCNLTNDAFPKDLSSMSGLHEIDLSENPISTLPDCITAHTGIDVLVLESCPKIQSIEWTKELRGYTISDNSALQKLVLRMHRDINYDSIEVEGNPCLLGSIHLDHDWHNVSRLLVMPLENASEMMIQDLGLSNSWTIRNPRINLYSNDWMTAQRIDPQVIWENELISTYLPGSSNSIPATFSLRNKGSSISFIMPSSTLNSIFKGFNVCFLYTLSPSQRVSNSYCSELRVHIRNQNKSLLSTHHTFFCGIPEDDHYMTWFLYPLYQNTEVEAGDEVNISWHLRFPRGLQLLQMKEIGVGILYRQEKDSGSQLWKKYDLEFLNRTHLRTDLAQKLGQNVEELGHM